MTLNRMAALRQRFRCRQTSNSCDYAELGIIAIIHIRTKVTHDGVRWVPKDKTDRKLPLNDELKKVLDELLAAAGDEPKGYVFPGRPGPHPAKNLARSTLKELKDLSTVTGIPKSKFTLHNFLGTL